MKRIHRSLVTFAILAVLLIFFVYANVNAGAPSRGERFAWTTIRYKTTASELPKPLGACPGLTPKSKSALVVSHVQSDGDQKWLSKLQDRYHLCVYHVDSSTGAKLRVPANRGHEAMTYLTYIIDNYDDLPDDGSVFIHGSRFSWHNDSPDYDNQRLLAALDVRRTLEHSGYHNLRCDWSASMCDYYSSQPQTSLQTQFSAMFEPWNQRAISDAALPKALESLFGHNTSALPVRPGHKQAIRAQCCAQFAVSRERIRSHSRDEYMALRQWLLDVDNEDAAPHNDRIAGRVLSYLWHVLFLKPDWSDPEQSVDLDRLNQMACPSAKECYCRLYGRCDMQDCSPGRCHGEYTVPDDFTLPKDWAETHS